MKRWRKRRERKRLREELEAENLVVKRSVVSAIDGTAVGEVTLGSGEVVSVSSAVMFRPTFKERLTGRRFVSLRRAAMLVGNIEIQRGGVWLPKPPLDITGTTSSGKLNCFDARTELAVKFLLKHATF